MKYALTKKSGVIQLEFSETGKDNKINSIVIDFFSPELKYRYQHGGGMRQLLAKAVGIKPNYRPKILDATAGFGIDAVILARFGCAVEMLERSPIIYSLLADGLKRAHTDLEFKKLKLKLRHQDALDYLDKLCPKVKRQKNDLPDVIYLDPIFPERKKSALNKIEMRVLREVVGDDLDADKLLEKALFCAKKRVVVKRSRLAPSLAQREPDIKFLGKSCRFDVYLIWENKKI